MRRTGLSMRQRSIPCRWSRGVSATSIRSNARTGGALVMKSESPLPELACGALPGGTPVQQRDQRHADGSLLARIETSGHNSPPSGDGVGWRREEVTGGTIRLALLGHWSGYSHEEGARVGWMSASRVSPGPPLPRRDLHPSGNS